MAFLVSPIDLRKDRDVLVDFLTGNLSSSADGKRYDWLYTKCPFGPALAWFARDSDSGTIVGAAAAFPRRFQVGGSFALGWVLGDFCIRPDYRSLGPALKLQRVCLENGNGDRRPLYDFPGSSMVAIYKRLGMEPTERLVRMAKPLRADRKVRERVKNPVLARGFSAAANKILAFGDRRMKNTGPWTLSLLQGPCAQAFNTLSQSAASSAGLWIDRTAEYLNWRYLQHPSCKYEILTAYRDGTLQGYLVFTNKDGNASIVDWFGLDNAEMLQALVKGAVILLRERGAMTLSASLLQSHPRVAQLKELGFRERESQPVILQSPTGALGSGSTTKPQWFLMDGDRES
jgi:hypothetical protein